MQSVADFEIYIERCEQQHIAGTDYGFVIKAENKVVGRIGVHYIDQRNSIGAIGYWIGEGFSGKGIVTRACQSLIRFCFEDAALNRIEIKCATGNLRSAAIAERLGFQKEGILREAERVNSEFLDLNLYSFLKSEWQKHINHGIQ
jgi:ribosomal-protein-serine acetyltransferase